MAKKPKPWDMPPPEKEGNATPDEIFRTVGMALSWWEGLQTEMMFLFGELCVSDSLALSRAFGMIESVITKTDMMREAAKTRFANKGPWLEKIKDLLTEIGQFNLRRNDIAHGIVGRDPKCNGYFLMPGMSMSKKTNFFYLEERNESYHLYRLTAAQISAFTLEFSRLSMDCMKMRNALSELRTPPNGLLSALQDTNSAKPEEA